MNGSSWQFLGSGPAAWSGRHVHILTVNSILFPELIRQTGRRIGHPIPSSMVQTWSQIRRPGIIPLCPTYPMAQYRRRPSFLIVEAGGVIARLVKHGQWSLPSIMAYTECHRVQDLAADSLTGSKMWTPLEGGHALLVGTLSTSEMPVQCFLSAQSSA